MSSRYRQLTAFAASILVIATVAAAVPAAAAPASVDRTVASETVAPGGTASVTVNVTMDEDGGSLSLNEEFSGPVASADVTSVTVDGASADPVLQEADTNGAVVTLTETAPGAAVEITYEVVATDSEGTIELTGTVSGSGTDKPIGTSAVNVQTDPLAANSTVAATEVAANDTTTAEIAIENPRSELSVDQTFSPAVANASVSMTEVDGEPVDPVVAEANPNGSVVTFDGLSNASNATVVVEVTMPDTIGTSIELSGTVTSGTDDVTVEPRSVSVVDPDPVSRYDDDGDGIEINELGTAAGAYATGELSIVELGEVASAYAA